MIKNYSPYKYVKIYNLKKEEKKECLLQGHGKVLLHIT